MEKFIKLKENISISSLGKDVSDNRMIILRESKITGTIQIKIFEKMSTKQIKNAFYPHKVKKIYDEFPYPLPEDGFIEHSLSRLKKIFVI